MYTIYIYGMDQKFGVPWVHTLQFYIWRYGDFDQKTTPQNTTEYIKKQ